MCTGKKSERSFNTLAQNRTEYFTKNQCSISINGVGTKIIDNPSLLKRANKKVITNALVLSLIDVAQLNDEVKWVKRYWRSFHCQNEFIESDGRIYTNLCKNRWCATCCGIRKAELINKYYPELIKWEEPHLLTLTLSTVRADEIDQRVDDMVKAFARIKDRCNKRHKRSMAMKIKGIKSLESNFNAHKRWYNPHFHIITPNRKIALYIKQEWKKEWNKNGLFMASEKGQDVRKIENIEKGLIEVIKYGAKMLSEPDPNRKRKRKKSDLDGLNLYANGLHTIYKALDSHQLFKSFGFKLSYNEKEISSSRSIDDFEIWKYSIEDMDWVNNRTGERLTDYEIDHRLYHLLKNSIDKVLN